MKNPDDVLAELENVGAVGGPLKAPAILEDLVTEVTIEKGPPSVVLRDLRGGQAVEALDSAVRHLDAAIGELTGLRESLVRLREVWEPVGAAPIPKVAVETPETASKPPDASEAPSPPQAPSTPVEPQQEPLGDDYERAREAALRKIRGEDIPETAFDEEDDVPFVGQTRAPLLGQEPEEVTIGTVGTIEPNFPVEE